MAQDTALELAGRFFRSENFPEAVTEYRRYLFFHATESNEQIAWVHHQVGFCYRQLGLWSAALSWLEKAIQVSADQRTRDEWRLDLAVTYLASANHSAAEFYLIKVEKFSSFPELRRRASFFRGVNAVYQARWAEAEEALRGYFKDSPDATKWPKVAALLKQARKLHRRSPTLAKILSLVLPGSGQIYCGYWGTGINALVVNAATVYLALSDLLPGRIASFLFNSLFLFERFYRGNIQNTKELVRRRNEEAEQRFAEQILAELSHE